MLLVCLAVGVVEARGEAVIYLVNGDRMTGRIVAETPTGISLQTAWSGTVQIPRSQVVRTERRMSGVGAPPANRASAPCSGPLLPSRPSYFLHQQERHRRPCR